MSVLLCGRIFTAITKSHPQRNEVFRSDLDKCLPNIQDIQNAFVKVRQICVVGEPHCNFQLLTADKHFDQSPCASGYTVEMDGWIS